MERNRYLDGLRVCALGLVVLGHWLVTDVTYHAGRLSGLDALDYISWASWLTLPFQVMPVFFLVGGYVNALSWTRHSATNEPWWSWLRGRSIRLLWPTTVYLAFAEVAVIGAAIAGVSHAELAQAAWLVGLQLWFLPVYLLLIAITPVMLRAHQRWGLAVPVAMALGAGGVDVTVLAAHLPLIGFGNYLLVWGCMYQWGFAWQDGQLSRARWRPVALAGIGLMAFIALVGWGPFPLNVVGTHGPVQNTVPPSVALLAFAAAQAGLVIAAEPVGQRVLAAVRPWRLVSRLNSTAITVFLWHMAPVIFVAIALYPTGALAQPSVGSQEWWELRPAWIAMLAVVLAPITLVMMRFDWRQRRPSWGRMAGLGTGGCAPQAGVWSSVLVTGGLVAALAALARISIEGMAPGGSPPGGVLASYICGCGAVLLAGYVPAMRRATTRDLWRTWLPGER